MTESTLDKVNTWFWVFYILVAIFSGFMNYQYLPNESYDESKHELLESHFESCGTENMQSCEVFDKWRDDATGKIYTFNQFPAHRRSEAGRISITVFAYGLIWCLFSASRKNVLVQISRAKIIEQIRKTDENYIEDEDQSKTGKMFLGFLKSALIIDFFASLLVYWMI